MKIEDVILFMRATKVLFDLNKDDVMGFDDTFDDPWEDDELVPMIDEINEMVITEGLIGLNKDDTVERNKFMDKLTPILADCEYAVKKGRRTGSITDGLSSFGFGAFNRSIKKRDIALFHTSYVLTIARLSANSTALNALGFGAGKRTSITTNHNGAYALQGTKIELKGEISELSVANQVIIKDGLGMAQLVINAMFGYAKASNNTVLMGKATAVAILKSVSETLAKEPRYRYIEVGSSIVLRTDMVAKNLLQCTLETDVVVTICRQVLKTDACTMGEALPYNKMWEGKLKNITGTGRYVKLTNMSTTKKAKVLVFEVDVIRA